MNNWNLGFNRISTENLEEQIYSSAWEWCAEEESKDLNLDKTPIFWGQVLNILEDLMNEEENPWGIEASPEEVKLIIPKIESEIANAQMNSMETWEKFLNSFNSWKKR